MKNYLELCQKIINEGVVKENRTGINTKSLFGQTLRWDLSEGFPIITTRKVSLRIAFEETMFFLRGETDTQKLEDKNVNIWKGNTTREFLDKVGLDYLPEKNMGKGYSFQMRNFGGMLDAPNSKGIGGVDQIKELLDGLKADPNGRRHIVTHWNPQDVSQAALPPCHIMHMYSVADGKLNSSFILRSNDVIFGLPYNIMGYAFLNHAFSKYLGLIPGELVYFGWDAHIYANQEEMIGIQLNRKPKELPTFEITKDLSSLEDILSLEVSDLNLIGYDPYPDINNKPAMAV
jgi:thymidylate synthase